MVNRLWLKFAITQAVNAPLIIVGLFICLYTPLAKASWLWWNDDDGARGATWWERYKWLALRNPVDNLKHVKWPIVVATPGGPLLYNTWFWGKRQFYYKIGYMPHEGYPAFQPIGGGRGW